MMISSIIDRLFMGVMDLIYDRRAQPVPVEPLLRQSRIISHRGEHDQIAVKENTLAAFEQAAAAGVWGIELDVRWTRDLVPVVAHDPDLRRLYGYSALISDVTQERLKQIAPEIPSLGHVAQRFGTRLHLMIEIKKNHWPDPERQNLTLKEHLGALEPMQHYHLMALHPETLLRLGAFPSQSLVAIANHRPYRYGRWVIENHWGGLCAHYAMMSKRLIRQHQARRTHIGTAYPASRNCLFREINRGVDWIFSNDAARLQRIIDRQTIPG